MKCKCGGNLKRIAVDCYECEVCGLKQKMAFAPLPTENNYCITGIDLAKGPEITVEKNMIIGIVGTPRTSVSEIIRAIEKHQIRITNAYEVEKK